MGGRQPERRNFPSLQKGKAPSHPSLLGDNATRTTSEGELPLLIAIGVQARKKVLLRPPKAPEGGVTTLFFSW